MDPESKRHADNGNTSCPLEDGVLTRRSGIKGYLSHILAVVFAILFFISGHFFLTAYDRYARNERRLEKSVRQVRVLQQHREEQARNRRILARVKRFVDRARALGVEKDKWDYYPVQIDEPVSFPNAQKILSQTINTASYYFNPSMLNIRKSTEPEPGEEKPSAASADSPDTRKGDIFLNLRGQFVVRQR